MSVDSPKSVPNVENLLTELENKTKTKTSQVWYRRLGAYLVNTTAVRIMSESLIRKFTIMSVLMYTFTMVAYFGSAYYASNLPGKKLV